MDNLATTGNMSYIMNPATVEETVVETGGISAESEASGIRMNLVPKEGRNSFKFGVDTTYMNRHMQSDNLSDTLRERGAPLLSILVRLAGFEPRFRRGDGREPLLAALQLRRQLIAPDVRPMRRILASSTARTVLMSVNSGALGGTEDELILWSGPSGEKGWLWLEKWNDSSAVGEMARSFRVWNETGIRIPDPLTKLFTFS